MNLEESDSPSRTTDEPPNPYAAPGDQLRPLPTYYGEAGTVSTASVIAAAIAMALGGLILLCSGLGVTEMISNYRDPPEHFAGFITGHCVIALLGIAGASLFLVLIEFRRRLFLILMGAALTAIAGLLFIALAVYGWDGP